MKVKEEKDSSGVSTEKAGEAPDSVSGLVLDERVLSPQSFEMIEELTRYGIYGQTREEVAARFIDAALINLVQFIDGPLG